MTREEAIKKMLRIRKHYQYIIPCEETIAIDMAIEALTEPKTIIGIDIPYGSDKGIATIFKGKDEKLILEEVKEIMSVVHCKDCKWQKFIDWGMGDCLHPKGSRHIAYDNHYCSYGERREK